MDAEEIGRFVFQFFEQMKLRNLTLHTPYKNYWLMPKGIRSFKKYVEATFSVDLRWDGDVFSVCRWVPAPDRGFEPNPSSKDLTISNFVSAKESGELLAAPRAFPIPASFTLRFIFPFVMDVFSQYSYRNCRKITAAISVGKSLETQEEQLSTRSSYL